MRFGCWRTAGRAHTALCLRGRPPPAGDGCWRMSASADGERTCSSRKGLRPSRQRPLIRGSSWRPALRGHVATRFLILTCIAGRVTGSPPRRHHLGTAVGGSACHARLSRGTTWLVMPTHHFDGAARRPGLAPALRTLLLPAHTGHAAARSTRQDPGSRHLRPARSLGPRSGSADGIHCLSP